MLGIFVSKININVCKHILKNTIPFVSVYTENETLGYQVVPYGGYNLQLHTFSINLGNSILKRFF